MPELDQLDDIIWILFAASLVMLMQGGFTLLETGLVRAKNSINVAIKNLVDFCLSSALFWFFGFGLMFGQSVGGWVGITGFFGDIAFTPWLTAFFLFQLVFAGTATTIVSGAVAERIRFSGYLVVAFVVAALIYPVAGHWIWGGLESGTATGWLAQRGFIDFAGATVVHSVGGWVALAAVLNIGPRLGRFGQNKTRVEAHNLPMAALGVLLLWFGWYGLTGGSTFSVTPTLPLIMVNTTMSGAFGGLAALSFSWIILGHTDVKSVMNGILAGLVAITASVHIMPVPIAVFIGLVGGTLSFWAVLLLHYWQVDDAVGAFPVHAVAGVWGTLAVALVGDPATWGTGLNRGEQFVVQLTGVGAIFVWAFGFGFAVIWLLKQFLPMRVTAQEEEIGLNISEHGAQEDLQDFGLIIR